MYDSKPITMLTAILLGALIPIGCSDIWICSNWLLLLSSLFISLFISFPWVIHIILKWNANISKERLVTKLCDLLW